MVGSTRHMLSEIVYVLDYYHEGKNVSEFWSPAKHKVQTGIDYDVHDPFTDGFNQFMVSKWNVKSQDLAVNKKTFTMELEPTSHITEE